MSLETMIGSLSREEKLAAMDLIWQDLTTDPQSFAFPKWHERLSPIDSRILLRGRRCL